MSRKPIPDSVQKNVLMKSRRRCCVCFWLTGKDEVQKGQLCHLDQNNENNAENNLVFLCFDHHDDYDGQTRIAKGLLESEVRNWRDELYKELDDRNRTRKEYSFSLKQVRPIYVPDNQFAYELKLTNLSNSSVRSPVIAIQLVEGVKGAKPKKTPQPHPGGFGVMHIPDLGDLGDINGAYERKEDFFEAGGRVAIKSLAWGAHPIMHSGHSISFEALGIQFGVFSLGHVLELRYRVDAEGMPTFEDAFQLKLPADANEFFPDTGDEDEE